MRILVIRRDNIGDLVCTTPLLHAIRQQVPTARIEVLTTRYTEAVLRGNPDVDAVHVYTKGKHRQAGESVWGWLWQRLSLVWRLRRHTYDWVVLPGAAQSSALNQARAVRSRQLLVREDGPDAVEHHEVELCCHLLRAMGLVETIPKVTVVAETEYRHRAQAALKDWEQKTGSSGPLVALHISARKPSQRWSAENFATLARHLHERGARCLLLWSPGAQDDPLHPGDDEKAAEVLAAAGQAPILPMPTAKLEELIGALSICDAMICGDGGAMHLAAGLGKPIVAMFGQSDVIRWRPWGIPQAVLQKPSRDVADISVEEVLAAWEQLQCASSQLAPTPTSANRGTES